MKYILFTLLAIMLCQFQLLAQDINADQSVVATAGGSDNLGNLNVTWTLGEVFIPTFTVGDLSATQGFNQPKKKDLPEEACFETTLFIDDNANGNYDSAESPLANALITLIAANGETFTGISDVDGFVSICTPPGSYSINIDLPGGYVFSNGTSNAGDTGIDLDNDATFEFGTNATIPVAPILDNVDCVLDLEQNKELDRRGALYAQSDFPIDGDEVYCWFQENGTQFIKIAEFTGNPYYSPADLGIYQVTVTDPDFPDCVQLLGPRDLGTLDGCCELPGDN